MIQKSKVDLHQLIFGIWRDLCIPNHHVKGRRKLLVGGGGLCDYRVSSLIYTKSLTIILSRFWSNYYTLYGQYCIYLEKLINEGWSKYITFLIHKHFQNNSLKMHITQALHTWPLLVFTFHKHFATTSTLQVLVLRLQVLVLDRVLVGRVIFRPKFNHWL